MLTAGEITAGFYGAWRLAHFDASGMRWFDRSTEGVWRSFLVAVLIAPGWALILYMHDVSISPPPDLARYVAVQAIAYVMLWVTFPLVLSHLAPLVDRQEELADFIVAYNWSAIPQMALMLPLAWLLSTEGEASGWIQALVVVGRLALFAYQWFIVKTALRLGGLSAGGVVILDLLISLTITEVSDQMIGGTAV